MWVSRAKQGRILAVLSWLLISLVGVGGFWGIAELGRGEVVEAASIQTKVVVPAGTAISASGSYTSQAISVGGSDGFFAAEMTIAGSGTAKLEYQIDTGSGTFREPEEADDIFSGITATSGGSSDGVVVAGFHPPLCQTIRFLLTETGGANPITATVMINWR